MGISLDRIFFGWALGHVKSLTSVALLGWVIHGCLFFVKKVLTFYFVSRRVFAVFSSWLFRPLELDRDVLLVVSFQSSSA